ncbi:serine-rich adhesin for platelets-like isoform X2 [Channa argus]|uniref:serine-rich adhesin for platelets-like isoform X2 n=2 Tax=Channa argus TaxID=215402 RepID=UPI00352107DF
MSVFEGGTLSSREVTSSWFDSEEGREAALSHQSLNMDVHHILICFFFLSLQDGNTGLTNAQITTHTGTEGGNITVGCSFSLSGSRKLFCKGDCTTGNILTETTSNRAQSSRYSIEYKEGSLPSPTLMYVSITQLNKSDSGLYRCSLDRILPKYSDDVFEIIVTEASTSSPPSTALQPSTTSHTFSSLSSSSSPSSSSPLSSTQSLSSSSGRFTTSSSSSTETYKQPETGSSGAALVISLILVFMIIILSVAVLIFCRKRSSKFKGSPVETVYDNVRESSRVYEEVRDPVEASTVYTLIHQDEVRTTDIYSLATDTCAQDTEDNSGNLVYSEVDVPKREASSPCADTDKVVYSEPRVEASSRSLPEDASPPLYSVALPQEKLLC